MTRVGRLAREGEDDDDGCLVLWDCWLGTRAVSPHTPGRLLASLPEGAFGSESKVLKRIGSTGQQASIAISKVSGSSGPLSAEPLGVLAVLGVVFPRSLQDMPTRLEELLTILILIRQRMQERKLLGAEAGVPVSGGKREGTQYDLTLVGRNS
ncbi:hypothetical protein SDJN03_08788, partial [Cucurbita argyrosperma subsp. sororia]